MPPHLIRYPWDVRRIRATLPRGVYRIVQPQSVQSELKGAEMKVAVRPRRVHRHVRLMVEDSHRGGGATRTGQHGARQLEHVVRHWLARLVGVSPAAQWGLAALRRHLSADGGGCGGGWSAPVASAGQGAGVTVVKCLLCRHLALERRLWLGRGNAIGTASAIDASTGHERTRRATRQRGRVVRWGGVRSRGGGITTAPQIQAAQAFVDLVLKSRAVFCVPPTSIRLKIENMISMY